MVWITQTHTEHPFVSLRSVPRFGLTVKMKRRPGEPMIKLQATSSGVLLPVKARPAGKKNAITGEHDGALKVTVTAAPEKGKANAAIVALLAEQLACASRISRWFAARPTATSSSCCRDRATQVWNGHWRRFCGASVNSQAAQDTLDAGGSEQFFPVGLVPADSEFCAK